jgi:hypothetical protein
VLYHRVIMPALQLLHLLMVHLGGAHATLRNDVLDVLITHKEAAVFVLEAVLRRSVLHVFCLLIYSCLLMYSFVCYLILRCAGRP